MHVAAARRMRKSLRDCVAVITGGGSGLGEELALGLARCGARPVIVDLRPDRVERVVARLGEAGADAGGWACDVGKRDEVARVFSAVGRRFGRIDILVNCAGRSMLRPFLDMTDEDLDWVLGPNLLGVAYCIRSAVPWMPPGSRIVNVSSVSGAVPTPGEAFYSAAKAAVVSLSGSLEAELHGRGIGLTVVLPGEMSTALFAEHPSWRLRPAFQRGMEVAPARVARAVIRAIERGRGEVIVPWYMRLVVLLYRLGPRPFRWGVAVFYYRPLAERISTANAPRRYGPVNGMSDRG